MDISESYGDHYRKYFLEILAEARKLTHADEAIVFMHNKERNELYRHMRVGKEVGQTLSHRVRLEESKILCQLFDGATSVRTTSEAYDFLKAKKIGALCCSALKKDDTPFGVLFMINRKRAFTAEEEDALNAFTKQKVTALNNVILQEKVSLSGEVMSRFHRVSQELLSEHSKDLRQVVVREAGKLLGADFALLYEYDPQSKRVGGNPAIDGELYAPAKLHKVVSDSNASIVVKMAGEAHPFFAPIADEDWIAGMGYKPDTLKQDFLTREKVVSSAGVPLIAQGEVVGVLFVNYRTFRPFTLGERERIGLFAQITAMALRKDRISKQQRRSLEHLKVLNELGERLNRPLDSVHEIYKIVHQQTGKLMNVDNFYIAIWDSGKKQISFPFAMKGGSCVNEEDPAYRNRLYSDGLTELVLDKRQPVLLDRDIDLKLRQLQVNLTGDLCKSWLGVPIIFEEQILGMIGVHDFEEEGAYDFADREILHTIATQLAPVLEQRRLIIETHKKNEELELLRKAELAIGSKESLQERLQTIVGNAAQLLGAQGGKLYKLSDDKKLHLLALEGDIRGLKPGRELGFGEGLSGQVIAENKPQLTNDYSSYPERLTTHGESFKRLLGVPLSLADGSVLGVLTVFDVDGDHEFTRADIPVLERFGRYVAQAMRDGDQRDLVEKQVSRLRIINRSTRSISTKLNLDEYLSEIVVTIKKELGCDQCTILMRERMRDGVYLVQRAANQGLSRDLSAIRFPINNKSLASRVYISGESEIFANAPAHPEFDSIEERPYLYTSMMLVPMQLGTKCIGIICVDDNRPGWFKNSDQEWVEALALNIAIALQSDLAAQGQQELSTQLLSKLGTSNSEKADEIQQVMESVAEQAIKLTHASSCVLYLLNEDKTKIVEKYHPEGNEGEHPVPRTKADGKFSGLTGWMIEHKKTVHIHNVKNDERVNPDLQKKIQSLIGVPLKDKNEVVGVLYVNHVASHTSTAIETRFLKMLADQAALALKKHALLQRTVRTRSTARSIGNLALVEDWTSTLKSLVKGARYALGCDAAVVIPYNEVRAEFERPVLDGVWNKNKVYEKPEEIRHTAHYRILDHKESIHFALDSEQHQILNGDFVLREAIKSAVGVRLEVQEKGRRRIVGVMFFNYRNRKIEFGEQEKEDIELFASLAANTIRSAQIYHKLDNIRATARTFASKNLGIKKDSEGTLSSIASGIKETLQCDLVALHEYWLEEKKFLTPFHYAGNREKISFNKRGSYNRNNEPAILRFVLSHEDMLTTNDGGNEELLKGSFSEREGIHATAALALGVGEEKVGVLFVSYRRHHWFTETEKEDIKLFADQAAIAIRNAQLYEGKEKETLKYQTVLHNSPGGVLAVNRQGKVIFVNEKLREMLRYEGTELVGKHVDALYGGGQREARQIFRELVRQGRLDQYDASALTRDGHRIPTLLTAALMEERSNDPEEVFGIGIVEDQRVIGIGGRIGKVLELTDQLARYERMHEVVNLILLAGMEIFNASDIGCLLIKEDGHFKVAEESNCGHVISKDQTLSLDHSLITRKAMEGKPFVIPDFPPAKDQLLPFSKTSRSGVLIPFVGDNECLGGLYLEKDIPNFFNELDDMLGVFAAQGALALMRAKLIQKQKSWDTTKDELFDMSKAMVAGQIASTFLHEVKNSLNIIVVNARQLKRKIEKESGIKKKGDYLALIQAIHDGVKGSAKLAKDSQQFKGKLVANKKKVYLNEVLDRTLKLVEPALHKKRLKHEVNWDSTLSEPAQGKGHRVFIDEGLIELVLINLIMNAIDASSERSKILVTSKRDGSWVQFEVIDYGHGIDQKNIGNIFRPFYTLKKQTGVGLGLYICQLIVEDQHQGAIEVKSVSGKTTFTVRLPVNSQS